MVSSVQNGSRSADRSLGMRAIDRTKLHRVNSRTFFSLSLEARRTCSVEGESHCSTRTVEPRPRSLSIASSTAIPLTGFESRGSGREKCRGRWIFIGTPRVNNVNERNQRAKLSHREILDLHSPPFSCEQTRFRSLRGEGGGMTLEAYE